MKEETIKTNERDQWNLLELKRDKNAYRRLAEEKDCLLEGVVVQLNCYRDTLNQSQRNENLFKKDRFSLQHQV